MRNVIAIIAVLAVAVIAFYVLVPADDEAELLEEIPTSAPVDDGAAPPSEPETPARETLAETAELGEPTPDPAKPESAERPEPAVESRPAEPQDATAKGTRVVTRTALDAEDAVEPGTAGATTTTEEALPPESAPGVEEPVAPSFDVVRIGPTGRAVIAGRAAPGAEVSVRVDGEIVATATADSRGEWVAIPDQPLSSGSAEIDLAATEEDGATEMLSASVVVVDVPERAEMAALAEPVTPPEPVAAETAVDTAAAEAPSPTAGAEPEPAPPVALEGGDRATGAVAILLPREGGGPIKVLQAPRSGDGADGGLRLEVIDYNSAGDIVLSGRSSAGTTVRAFVDNAAVGGVSSFEGTWRLVPEVGVSPGRHSLRVEEVSEAGVVTASLEMPFSRAAPDDIKLTAGQVIVQPGNSLWRIARRTYGQGVRYTIIFLANRDQITEPDLIYPGQVFTLPQTE